MKLRVKYFSGGYWVVQQKRFLFWEDVTESRVYLDSRDISSRHVSLLFADKQEAISMAERLSDPAEMKNHTDKEDRIWSQAKKDFSRIAKERKDVWYSH